MIIPKWQLPNWVIFQILFCYFLNKQIHFNIEEFDLLIYLLIEVIQERYHASTYILCFSDIERCE